MNTRLFIACVLCVCALASAKLTTRPAATNPSVAAATTEPTTQASATTQPVPANFPTPAELIEKMRAARKQKESLPHVAYFDLTQRIVEKPADFSFFGDPDATTLRSLLDRIRQAKADKNIRGVLLTLGAGSDLNLAQALELRDALQEASKAGKQTFVYADSYDTASYIAASGANHVCMLEGGEIMMPGVGMEAMFARGLLDKVGVKADYIQIGEYKGADEEYTRTEASEQLRGEMNKLADSLYQQIVDTISLDRNLPADAVRAIIDDAMISGVAAKERGLVDHLLDQDELRDLMADEIGGGKKVEVVHDYGKPEREEIDFSNPFALFASMAHRPQPSGKPQVALVYLDGVITDGEGGESMFGGDSVGSETLRKALRNAARDENVKAVVIRIDSPGGSALASEVIWQAARHVAEKKPVIISVGHMAASGGYYVASAGDRIFADPSAIVGSIGVVGGKFVWKDLYSKLGVATETFSKGRNATLFSTSTPFTDRQRKLITTWMKQTYDQFTDRIKTTRGEKIKSIDDVARGRIFAAKQAKDLGLVDELGGLQSAVNYAAKKADLKDGAYDIKVLPQPRTFADLFAPGGNPEALSNIQPKIRALDVLFGALDPRTRSMLSQQLNSLALFQRHPVVLVSPVMVNVR